MAISPPIIILILSLIAISSLYFIIISSFLNGFMGLAESWAISHPALLPFSTLEAPIYIRESYSGFRPLDALVGRLTPVFWPLINVEKPELTIFGVYMFGQIWASETIVIVEGWRVGNMGRAVSFSTLWGLTWQSLPWGFIQPVYCLIHLLTSPLSTSLPPTPALLSASTSSLRTLPYTLLVGYALPSILMCLPAPRIISYNNKQLFLSIWQLFPLWITLSHFIIKSLTRLASPIRQKPLRSILASRTSTTSAFRTAYSAALAISAITHLSTILLVLLNRPLARLSLLPQFLTLSNPFAVFRPWPVIPNFAHYGQIPQVSDMAEGFLVLLQYDMLFAGLGVLVWALWVRGRVGGVGYKWAQGSGWMVVRSALWKVVCFGPCGAAVGMLWERDESVFGRSAGEGRKSA